MLEDVAGINEDTDVYNSFWTLAEQIKNGNPGLEEFDKFSLYDGWMLLCKNSEKYWTEYPPYFFNFPIEKGDLNYETRTASYNVR